MIPMGRKAGIKLFQKGKNELESARRNIEAACSFVSLPCFNRCNENYRKEFLKKM